MAFEDTLMDLAVTVIHIDNGRRLRSYRVSLDTRNTLDVSDFEDEAWRRAVQEQLVSAESRGDYCFELR